MSQVELMLPVPNAPDLAPYYNQVMIFCARGGQTQAGWMELTTPSTRPQLRADQLSYRVVDPAGGPNDLYAAGFINTNTGAVSPLGEPVSGAGDPTAQLLTPDDIRSRYLFGLSLQGPDGTPLPDELFAHWRRQAVAYVERQVGVVLTTQVVAGEQHDFVRPANPGHPIRLETNLLPVQRLQALRVQMPYQGRSQPVPLDWVRTRGSSGKVYVYPRGPWLLGDLEGLGAWRMGGGWAQDLVPVAWQVDYVAGWPPGQVPADLLDAVGKAAALAPLMILGDLLGKPGTTSRSLSIDSLSQSVALNRGPQSGVFGARVMAYQQELTEALARMRTQYHGLPLYGM